MGGQGIGSNAVFYGISKINSLIVVMVEVILEAQNTHRCSKRTLYCNAVQTKNTHKQVKPLKKKKRNTDSELLSSVTNKQFVRLFIFHLEVWIKTSLKHQSGINIFSNSILR